MACGFPGGCFDTVKIIGSQMLHGAGLFIYIYHKFRPIVGEYTSPIEHFGINLLGMFVLQGIWQVSQLAGLLQSSSSYHVPLLSILNYIRIVG